MSDVFISHVEEDADIALEIALGLEEAGYATWCYEVDSIPGPSYLIQTGQAIEQSKAVILVISPHSLGSRQITREVVRASERNKEFIPVRRDITHVEFQNRQPEWRQAVGAAASIGIPRQGVAGVLPRIIDGIKSSGIHPRLKTDAGRIVEIREAIGELQGRSMLEKAEEPPVPTIKSELEYGVAEIPEEKVKPAVSVERPTEAVKVATRPAWSWVGIALLSIALGLLAWGTVGTLIAEEILDLYVGMLIVALLFMISGTYCLRRGMAEDLRTMPVEGRIPNWWWLLPVVLAFIGGIISWAKQKDVNWRQAMNMLTLGIILTPIWTIPLVMFPALEAPIPAGQLIYEDDFSDPSSGWPADPADENCVGDYRDGEYYGEIKKFDEECWAVNLNAGQFTDFVLEIDARYISGPTQNFYGVVFRFQDDYNCYEFLVSPDGDYSINRQLNGVWTDLHSGTKSAFINGGYSTNHLKVVCQGSQIEVYVNEHYLATVTDNSFAGGYVGMVGWTLQPTSSGAFDNIRVYSAPVTPSTPPEAEFKVSSLNIAPNPVKVSEEAVVEISVENTGEAEGTDTVSLIVNGIVEQEKDIIVAGGAIESVSFVISKDSPGSYSIEIGGLECVLEVMQPAQLSTGTFLVRELRAGFGKLKIENELDLDAVVVLSNTEEPEDPLMAVYIQSKDSYTVGGIKGDTYVLYFALGEGWDSDLKKFIGKTSYKRVGYELDFISGENRYTLWTIPLHSVVTEPVSEDEFPELG